MAKKLADPTAFVREYLADSILTKVRVLETQAGVIARAGMAVADAMAGGGKWLIFGNGGSAADAQHLAAELVGRLYKLERRGLPALALTTDSSALTCVGNDYGFERVFERQVEGLARQGDVALGLSTSGNSVNVLKGLARAKQMGCRTLAFSGMDGGRLARARYVDQCITVAGDKTPHVQEAHIAMGHAICFIVERELQRRGKLKAGR